jgi:aromatic amino acid aminotransferase I
MFHSPEIYAKRCLSIISFLITHVPSSTIEIPTPSGGMFLWLRLRIENHPSFPALHPEEISKQVFQALIKEKVIVAPSEYFKAPSLAVWSLEEEAKRIFVRVSFALPLEEEMEEGAKRLGRALNREWKLEGA